MLLQPHNQFWQSLREPRNLAGHRAGLPAGLRAAEAHPRHARRADGRGPRRARAALLGGRPLRPRDARIHPARRARSTSASPSSSSSRTRSGRRSSPSATASGCPSSRATAGSSARASTTRSCWRPRRSPRPRPARSSSSSAASASATSSTAASRWTPSSPTTCWSRSSTRRRRCTTARSSSARHRVAAAACFLPLTLNPLLSKDLGTRHRAAIGITEDTDAVAVVVSEETGLISFVQGGQIRRGLDGTRLRAAMLDALEPRGREPAPAAEKKAETDTLSTEARG